MFIKEESVYKRGGKTRMVRPVENEEVKIQKRSREDIGENGGLGGSVWGNVCMAGK